MMFEGSRYVNTGVFVDEEGELLLESRPHVEFSKGENYTFKVGDTLDGIAYLKYGYSHLWWVILDSNPQYKTPMEIKIGDRINLPPKEEVLEYV